MIVQFLIYGSENFQNRYLELTAEKIQDQPLENEEETRYMVGSARLTQQIADQLMIEFPTISILTTWPVDWVTKGD